MRFNLAWAATASQNVALKGSVIILGFVSMTLAITSVRLAMRTPILIERPNSCFDHTIVAASSAHTPSEIESFVREALQQRFNSDAKTLPTYLSSDEETARTQEQKELSNRGMTQFIVVRGMKINESIVAVDTDRLISVGQIRSAFSFPLTVNLTTASRNEINPYGLQVAKIVSLKAEVEGGKNESSR